MGFLTALNGPEAGQRVKLSGNECILGRHPDCNIVVGVGAVSRQHAKISWTGPDYFVEDLRSRNGTFLNGQAIQQKERLRPGDRVRICDVEFLFETDVLPLPDPPLAPEPMLGGSVRTLIIEDQAGEDSSTIMSKVDVSSRRFPVKGQASPEVRLAALLEITQSLGRALALDEVLPQVLNSLFKIYLQADRGFIVMKTEKGALIPRWTKLRRPDIHDTIRISRTIIHKVMESKTAVLSADASNDALFASSQSIADFRIRSMMCAPLIDSDGQAFGALQIDTLDQRSRFQEGDLELLASIAAQASIAIDNAQLHDRAMQQRALQRDLELAREVQKGFLPDAFPNVPGFRFFHYYQPTSQVGGDYFDYLSLPDGRMVVLVADVVGHGVAAAMMMAKLSAEARYCFASEATPAAALTRLNSRIAKLTLDRFVTMVAVVINPATCEATIVNAGHMAPVVRRGAGKIEEPGQATSGLPLGIADGFEYEQTTIKIGSGDLLVLYTDGINEATNPEGEMYTIDRLRKHVGGSFVTPEGLGQEIVHDVRNYLAGSSQDDDMCLVCIGYDTPQSKDDSATQIHG